MITPYSHPSGERWIGKLNVHHPLARGLVWAWIPGGRWRYSNRVRDETRRGNDLTITGAEWALDPDLGPCLDFERSSGDNAFDEMNDALQVTTAFTFSAWIKPKSFDTFNTIIGAQGVGSYSSESAHVLLLLDGSANFRCQVVSGDSTSITTFANGSSTLAAGTAYHVAVTWDGSSLRVYVDGVEDGSAATSDSMLDWTDPGSGVSPPVDTLYMGGGRNNSALELQEPNVHFFDGKIGATFVHNRALAASEIEMMARDVRWYYMTLPDYEWFSIPESPVVGDRRAAVFSGRAV